MIRSLRLAAASIALLLSLGSLHAEPLAGPGTLTGAVRDAETGLPLVFVTVQVVGESFHATTDADGWFVITGLSLGKHLVELRRTGYQAAHVPVSVAAGAPAIIELHLESAPIPLARVVVTPSRFGVAEEMTTASATLTNAVLETLPQVGDDLYRTITRLPGLAADDFTANFWVRGAPNTQMLARLDGVELLEPFHLKDIDGALSVVDLQSISRLDLTTGGFTAEYGDRLAAVLSMETENGAGPGPRTSLGISLTGVHAMNRGEFAGGKGHWLVTGRRGYPDIAIEAEGREDEIFPRYWDAAARVEYRLNDRHTLSVHLLHADDTMKVHPDNDPELRSSYGSDYLWGRWRGTVNERLTGEAVLSFAQLAWHRVGSGFYDNTYALNLRDDRRLDTVGLRQDWTLSLNDRALIRTGLDVKSSSARYDYNVLRESSVVRNGALVVDRRTANASLRPDGTSVGVFVAPRVQPLPALTIEPSLRFDRQDHTGDATWSPRLNASCTRGRTTLRAAWGLYYQSQGLHELDVPDGDISFHQAERAEHRVLGVEHRLRSGISLRAEAYERLTTRLRPHWANLTYSYNVFPEVQSDRTRLAPTEGSARGIELMAQRRAGGPFEWSASYAISEATERIGGRNVPVARDQRHTFYVDASYAPNPKWRFSASWQYHTGWPVTDVVYSYVTLSNGKRTLVRSVGPAYAIRLPDYHRLDLRATRRFQLKASTVRVFVDVFNAYDRNNLLGYNFSALVQGTSVTARRSSKNLLPILPSAGVNWEF